MASVGERGSRREWFYDWVVSLWMVWLTVGTLVYFGVAELVHRV
jgi:hypothetical protein